jgi:peptidoglycan hydrolase-like protein with peptidoglycan-binding domain
VNTPRPTEPRRRPASQPAAAGSPPWVPIIAAASVIGVVLIAAIGSAGKGSGDGDGIDPSGQVDVSLTVPASTQPIVVDSASLVTKTQFAGPITVGFSGDEVRQLQQRLKDMGFEPGPIDGQFGAATQQAVWAYKKLVRGETKEALQASDNASQVTNELWQSMQDPTVIPPRRPQGFGGSRHMEIYLPEQVAIVFHDDRPVLITHISSGEINPDGSPKTFCETVTIDTDENGVKLEEPIEKAICAESKTPGGVFQFTRRYEGTRVGPLGGMYNPVYFNYGIAVHGAQNIPLWPASHGCIRVHNTVADVFPTLVERKDRVYVWGHDGKQPEQYSENESLPSFNRPDPNATTTTSTTTSTTTTTVVPVTVAPTVPTTVKPQSTTTTVTTPATTTTVPPATTTSAPTP